MDPAVTLGTGDKLGSLTINIDWWQTTRDLATQLRKIFGADGNWWKLLIIFAVIFCLGRLNARSRHRDQENRHRDREDREREKAKIRKEEMQK